MSYKPTSAAQGKNSLFRRPAVLDQNLSDVLSPRKKALVIELGLLLGLFALFHFYELTNLIFSLDDERGVYRVEASDWLREGRWATYLLETYVFVFPVLPFVPLAIFGLCAAVGYMFFVRAVGMVPKSLLALMLFPVFSSLPIWTHLTTFQSNTPPTGLGLVLACYAGYLFKTTCELQGKNRIFRGSLRQATLIVLLGTIATAFYQSLYVVWAVIIYSVVLAKAFRGSLLRELLTDVIRACCIGISAVILYGAVTLAISWLSGLQLTYLGWFVPGSTFRHFLTSVSYEMLVVAKGVYLGEASAYGTDSPGYAVLSILALAAALLRARRVSGYRGLLVGGIGLVVLLVAPFSVAMLADFKMALRTMIAGPIALTMLCILGFTDAPKWIARAAIGALLLTYITIFNNLGAYNTLRDLVQRHDLVMAAALSERIAAIAPPDSSGRGPIIEIFGAKAFSSPYKRPPTSWIGYSFFEAGGGTTQIIAAFMRVSGAPRYRLILNWFRPYLVDDFLSMPIWPAPGSVKLGPYGIVLIRLSEAPNLYYHHLVGSD